jgi:hypothetical protein
MGKGEKQARQEKANVEKAAKTVKKLFGGAGAGQTAREYVKSEKQVDRKGTRKV